MYVPADVPDDAGEVDADAEAPDLEHIPAEVADLDAEELDELIGHVATTVVAETLDKVRAGEVEGLGPTDDEGDAEQAVEALGGPRGFQ